jgi:hypothetical protein
MFCSVQVFAKQARCCSAFELVPLFAVFVVCCLVGYKKNLIMVEVILLLPLYLSKNDVAFKITIKLVIDHY